MLDPIVIRALFTSWTGYGQIAEKIGQGLDWLGYPVACDDYGADQTYAKASPWVSSHLDMGAFDPDWVVHVHTPHGIFAPASKTIFFTMWETSGLPDIGLSYLNRSAAVIVPNKWNVETFKAAGVTAPIYHVPLGVSPSDGYQFHKMSMDGPTVFGMAARLAHGGVRKGIEEGVNAFLDAFSDTDDVRLWLKLWPDCLEIYTPPDDPRIQVTTFPFRGLQMCEWYRRIHCLLVPSKGEGWGLHTHQAMATGRPVIAAKYSGTAEFFDSRAGWELDYKLEPAGGMYAGTGSWAVPTHESMVESLREAHSDRKRLARMGVVANTMVSHLTWENMALEVERVLKTVGAIGG